MKTSEQLIDRKSGKFGPREELEGVLRRRNVKGNDGEFEFRYDKNEKTQWTPFSVVDTDGMTYAIVYSCQLTYGGLIQNEYFWTLSREPLDSQNDKKQYEKVVNRGQKVFENMFDDFKYNVTMEEVIQGPGGGDQCTY